MVDQINSENQEFLENLLYFGSPNNITYFHKCNGKYYKFEENNFQMKITNNSINQSLQSKFSQKHLGKKYEKLCVPCVPAADLLFQYQIYQLPNCKQILEIAEEDTILEKGCYLKVKTKGPLFGYKSGKRSAILIEKNKCLNLLKLNIIANQENGSICYRLKGCGNNEDGFQTQTTICQNRTVEELRGAHYFSTTKRELFLTNHINKILEKEGFQCGNQSLGFWNYENDSINKIGRKFVYQTCLENISNDFPFIDKFCAVYKTLGEKRLSTHLLQGLEILLFTYLENQENFDINCLDQQYEKLTNIFCKDRYLKLKESKYIQLESAFVSPIESQESLKELADKQVWYNQNDEQSCINLLELVKANKFNMLEKVNKEILMSLKSNLQIDKLYETIFDNYIISLAKVKNFIELYCELYARIGWEIGKIKRIFLENSVNWGYFFDHDSFVAHCNGYSHPNNFIILPDKYTNILAPVDFDLAYLKKEFININYDEPSYGQNDESLFEEYQKQEQFQLESSLTGIQNMLNFSYYNFSFHSKKHEIIDLLFQGLKIALHDTLLYYFRKGFLNEKYHDIQNQNELHNLIKIALIISLDFQS